MSAQVQAVEMRFLRKIKTVTLLDKVRSSEIRKSLEVFEEAVTASSNREITASGMAT